MRRPVEIIFTFAICAGQICCGRADSAVRPSSLANKQAAPGAPFAQQVNQTNSKKLSGEEHWVAGNIARASAEYEKTVTEYQLAIENGYDTNDVRIELGIVLDHYLHRPEEAATQFRVAIERDEKDWRAHWSLANALLETQQYDEALRELEIVKQLDPQNTSNGFYAYYTAKASDGLGRTNEALEEYEVFLERAKKVEPNSPRVREVRARVEVIKGKSNRE